VIKQLVEKRIAKAKDRRFGDDYNFGATYYDARDEAIRRGDRTIGTEHLVLALLVDPASPTARAIDRELESARRSLGDLDNEALSFIGVEPGITAGPIAVRTQGRLRLTPTAKAIITNLRDARRDRSAGLEKLFNALLDLEPPDAAAELLAHLRVDTSVARERFTRFDRAMKL